MTIFACSILATKVRTNSTSTGHGARAIRAESLEAARGIAKGEAALNWPESEGWEISYCFTEVPHNWIHEAAQAVETIGEEG